LADVPNIANSAAQAGYVQAEAARARDAAQAGAAQSARRTAQSIDEADTTISTDDNDTQVYADSDGSGGTGRESGEEPGQAPTSDQQPDHGDGIAHDENGDLHLDIQA